MSKFVAAFVGLALVLCAPAAFAQAELGSITGTVTDAQGGALPGVTASAINLDTNVTTTVVTNHAGVYFLPSLVNGRYGDVHADRLQHRRA